MELPMIKRDDLFFFILPLKVQHPKIKLKLPMMHRCLGRSFGHGPKT